MYYKKQEGEKVYLSPISMDDVEKYVKWLNDSKVTDGLSGTAKMYTLENERDWIQKTLERGNHTFAIIKKEDDTLIGNCGFNELNSINQSASIGIFIGEEENRCNGYGTDALKTLIRYGFEVLNLHNIRLGVYSFNKQAISCYKKVGFKEYGRRHECYYLNGMYHDEISMEILKSDYEKLKKIIY